MDNFPKFGLNDKRMAQRDLSITENHMWISTSGGHAGFGIPGSLNISAQCALYPFGRQMSSLPICKKELE